MNRDYASQRRERHTDRTHARTGGVWGTPFESASRASHVAACLIYSLVALAALYVVI